MLNAHPHEKWTKIVGEDMSADDGDEEWRPDARKERSGSANRAVHKRQKHKTSKDKEQGAPTTRAVTRSMSKVPAAPGTVLKPLE